jgi:hypothetical protein
MRLAISSPSAGKSVPPTGERTTSFIQLVFLLRQSGICLCTHGEQANACTHDLTCGGVAHFDDLLFDEPGERLGQGNMTMMLRSHGRPI